MDISVNRFRWNVLIVIALLAGAALPASARVVLASRGPSHYRSPSTMELVLEAALAEPEGDQDADFRTSAKGFGSGTGYQLGTRLRHYLSDDFAVAPTIQYLRFGTASGVADYSGQSSLGYEIRTSNYRFGLDFQSFFGHPSAQVRPFLTGGVALINNRYRDELQYSGSYSASSNAPGYSFGVGVRAQNLELAGEYTINRFTTNKFDSNGLSHDYNWDYLVIRVGFAFGR